VGARPGQTPARSTPLTDYTTRWDAILAGGLRTALGSGYSRPSWWTARERMDWSMLSVHSTRLATAFCRWPTPCPCSTPVVREEAVHRWQNPGRSGIIDHTGSPADAGAQIGPTDECCLAPRSETESASAEQSLGRRTFTGPGRILRQPIPAAAGGGWWRGPTASPRPPCRTTDRAVGLGWWRVPGECASRLHTALSGRQVVVPSPTSSVTMGRGPLVHPSATAAQDPWAFSLHLKQQIRGNGWPPAVGQAWIPARSGHRQPPWATSPAPKRCRSWKEWQAPPP